MNSIGIFEAVGADDKKVVCLGCDDASLLKALYDDVAELTGAEVCREVPPSNTTLKRVGEIALQSVHGDNTEYKVAASPVGKPDTGRAPTGAAGAWTVQSLVFSKENFSLEEAQKWIKQHKQFVDVGADETDTSYRFRQYDPGYFGKFRTFDLADGIRAVYGQIKTEKSDDSDANKLIAASIADHDAVKALNERILKRSITLLADEDTVQKSDEEERYILGLVLEPNDGKNGSDYKPDTQGDIYSAKAVRDTAHGWMEKYGQVDLMHNWKAIGVDDVAVLESYLAPVDFDMPLGKKKSYKVCKGTWLVALRIKSDELWEAIKRGDIGAFSVGGKAQRTEV